MRVLALLALAALCAGQPTLRLTRARHQANSLIGPVPLDDAVPGPAATPQAVQAAGAPVPAETAGDVTVLDAAQATANLKPPMDSIPGEFIVLFEDHVTQPEATARVMATSIGAAFSRPSSTPGTAAAEPYAVVAATSASPAADGYVFPVKTATIRIQPGAAPDAIAGALRSQPGVAGVFPNRVYSKQQQVPCAQPSQLSGIKPPATLRWDGCLTPDTDLIWFGERCGPDYQSIQWTGVFAVFKRDGRPVPNCYTDYSNPQYRPGTAWGNAVFGSCGVAPTSASLPTRVCGDTSPCVSRAALSGLVAPASVSGCGVNAREVSFSGAPCGDKGDRIKWTAFALRSPDTGKLSCQTRAAGAGGPLFDRQWFGGCGAQPANFPALPTKICDPNNGGGGGGGGNPPPAPAPSPPPRPRPSPTPDPGTPGTGGTLPRENLDAGEQNLPGMNRIRAIVNNKVPVYSPPVTVAILDTGGTVLADLNTQPGTSFAGGSRNSDWSDHDKHGTHVSGTIGARNNGAGVFGVLPGIKVMPVKVLGNDGFGSMSDIMNAIDYVTTNGPALNIGVINLSLGGTGDVNDPICKSIQAAVNRGIVVVVAAGNDGTDLAGFSPAACPAAVAVTAINPATDAPAGFSNWLNPNSPQSEMRRTVAAPGVNILSTLPDGTYDSWQGTSMACPHVSGTAARCFAAGDCRLSNGAANREKFLDAIWQKYDSDPSYRWTNARTPAANGRYYGPLVWADRW